MARRPIWLTLGLGGLGLVGLVAASVLMPSVLVRFSPDGVLAPIFVERLRDLRALTAVLGCLLILMASRRGGWRGAVVVLSSLIWSCVLLNRFYPNHLVRRPKVLLDAVLGQELLLRDYDPRPRLTVPAHEVLRARYPVINIHAHFRNWYQKWTPEELVGILDACNVQALVNLDGGLGKRLDEALAQYAKPYPDRLIIFATFPFSKKMKWKLFAENVQELEAAKRLGARGIKIWKNLGLRTRDEHNRLVAVDDPRLDPLWKKAAELGLPILIHVGDPVAFFDPVDAHNERYEELKANPTWSFYGPAFPLFENLLAQFERMVARHPHVTFIFAHLGDRTDDLREAGGLLDRHPNLLMDISARVSELSRQPRTARDFMIKYQDRLLFGTDGNPDASVYQAYFRFLETADEYFDYPFRPRFNYGRWKSYGIDLPDEVLRKLYHDNAAKVLGLPLIGTDGKR